MGWARSRRHTSGLVDVPSSLWEIRFPMLGGLSMLLLAVDYHIVDTRGSLDDLQRWLCF